MVSELFGDLPRKPVETANDAGAADLALLARERFAGVDGGFGRGGEADRFGDDRLIADGADAAGEPHTGKRRGDGDPADGAEVLDLA